MREQQFDFGEALRRLKAGKLVTRYGWCTEGLFLYFVPGSTFQVNRTPLSNIYPEGTTVEYADHIDLGSSLLRWPTHAPWTPMMEDLLAEDWQEARPSRVPGV